MHYTKPQGIGDQPNLFKAQSFRHVERLVVARLDDAKKGPVVPLIEWYLERLQKQGFTYCGGAVNAQVQGTGCWLEVVIAERGDYLAVDLAGYAVEVSGNRQTGALVHPLLDSRGVTDQPVYLHAPSALHSA